MAKRTGIYTLNKAAKKMCSWLAKFAPIIAVEFSENADLQAALAAAQLACAALANETEGEIDWGD